MYAIHIDRQPITFAQGYDIDSDGFMTRNGKRMMWPRESSTLSYARIALGVHGIPFTVIKVN